MQVDLNRDFPDPFQRGSAGVAEPSGSEQPETLAMMHWIREGRFVVSANMHEVSLQLCARQYSKSLPYHATMTIRLSGSELICRCMCWPELMQKV